LLLLKLTNDVVKSLELYEVLDRELFDSVIVELYARPKGQNQMLGEPEKIQNHKERIHDDPLLNERIIAVICPMRAVSSAF